MARKFYEVQSQTIIEVEGKNGEGKPKKIKETYLIEALSVTAAEAIAVENFSTGSDFEIKKVVEKKYDGVLLAEMIEENRKLREEAKQRILED